MVSTSTFIDENPGHKNILASKQNMIVLSIHCQILYLTHLVHAEGSEGILINLLFLCIEKGNTIFNSAKDPFTRCQHTNLFKRLEQVMSSTDGIMQHALYLHMYATSYLDLLQFPPYKLNGSSLSA